MPWYYAGPDAKPVGPVTLEELHASRARGTIQPETYVIEHTGQPAADWSWKKYQEVFPPAPTPPPFGPPPAPPVSAPSPVVTAHPLFPSAAPVSSQPPVFPAAARPDPYYAIKPTNGWCAWGFGLGLASFLFSFVCLGILLAIPSLLLCIWGLTQLGKNPGQSGRGLALWGLALSTFALVISLVFIIVIAVPIFKAHELTVTEQTSNDSE